MVEFVGEAEGVGLAAEAEHDGQGGTPVEADVDVGKEVGARLVTEGVRRHAVQSAYA
ncbi:hypothetical protein ACWEPR_24440 [Streptomyces sp. NPDC004290]